MIQTTDNMKNNKHLVNNVKMLIPIILAFCLVGLYLFPQANMTEYSGDAADIWKTITSFHSDKIYGSYVLYKGINSVYPYVWLYDLANILMVNEWLFIKIFYCFIFVYIAAIGFPDMIELLTNQKGKIYRRCILIVVMWGLWKYTRAFDQLMIDAPCLMYFILLVNVALKIYRGKKNVYNYIWFGLLCGLNMSGSGQYTMPALCIIIFVLIITLKKREEFKKETIKNIITRVILMFMFVALVLGTNKYFDYTVVDNLREQGEWIPAGDNWLSIGLTRFMGTYRTMGAIDIPSNRNAAIFQDYLGDNYEELKGGFNITTVEYIKLFFRYPFDFILNYLNSFFLILSPDGGYFNFLPLFVFYSLLYIALAIGFKKCDNWRKFFSPLFWVGFSFLWATVPMLVMNIEPRTCMQIQGIILALAICDNTIWVGIKNCFIHVQSMVLGHRGTISGNKGYVRYEVLFYFVFIIFCFVHISSMYESIGVNAQSILIRFK